MESTIRVLIADDHNIVREGLRAVLGSEPDMEVVGEAATGEQVVERAAELRPGVILMDLELAPIGEYRMCQRAVRRLCNPCERCLVRKVARLLAQPLRRVCDSRWVILSPPLHVIPACAGIYL